MAAKLRALPLSTRPTRGAAVVLVLCTVFGISLADASGARGAGEVFHSSTAHASVLLSQQSAQVLVTPAGTVTCKKMVGVGTSAAQTFSELTITDVTYSECTTKTIFGTIAVTVNFNGCDYRLTTGFTLSNYLDILCPAGAGITVSGPGCSITLTSQTLKQLTYINQFAWGPGRYYLTVAAEVTNIKGTATGAFCSSTGPFTTGTYSGSFNLFAYATAGEMVDLKYE